MIYYFLPDITIFGGIKVGFQFVDILFSLGVGACVVTPEGAAPTWFKSSAPVLDQKSALGRITSEDVILFSLPHDYSELSKLPAKLVFHCQGTDPLIDRVLADENVVVLSCWEQAHRYIAERRKFDPIFVGISISDCFFYSGEQKQSKVACFMPRKGGALAMRIKGQCPEISLIALDGLHEEEVAKHLKRASLFLATAEGEWFGLPALEAMASGCVVLSVPVLGGSEYLKSGENCFVGSETELISKLLEIASTEEETHLFRLRQQSVAMAYQYRRAYQREIVSRQLQGSLSFLKEAAWKA